eukprot:7030649-Pyramimonas_sp.AAC.1
MNTTGSIFSMSSIVGATRSLGASSMLISDLGLKSLVLPPVSDGAPFFNFAPSLLVSVASASRSASRGDVATPTVEASKVSTLSALERPSPK